ncbi:MAG: signal peptide peptidase SppA [Planctomycetes bacterium]|nr:signal peptide peptidase SppA [Planctomycetota bacterium]
MPIPILRAVMYAAFPVCLLAQAPTATTQPAAPAADSKVEPVKQKVPFLRPNGAYEDLAEMAFDPTSLLTGGGAPPKPFYPLIEAIDGLGKQDAPTVFLDLSAGFALNLPQLREVERAIGRVKAAGKQIVCYFENAGPGDYQIAALCDVIVAADMGGIDLRSPAMSVPHLKDALDLLGIQADVTRVGEFKGAVEPYLLPQMSEHLHRHYQAMLTTMNEDVVRRIATGRRLSSERVRELQAERLHSAPDALAKGLIDKIVPWCGGQRAFALAMGRDDFEFADAAPKKKARNRDLLAMLSELVRPKKEEEIEEPQIVVLHLAGTIVDGEDAAAGNMVSGPSVKLIDELVANDEVKGVVVRINSPGGSATASEAIRLALQRLAAKKPLVFSMGELAASGGYWITTIGEPILAEAGTLTGSIGVFGMRLIPAALMRRIGLHMDVVKLDDGPDMDAMDRPWSDAARARMQALVDDIYARFLGNVAASRKMSREAVDKIAGGRVWSGAQAKALGLVDALGGLEDALAMVRQEGSLAADVEITHRPAAKNFADSLFGKMFEAHVQALPTTGSVLAAALQGLARDPVFALLVRQALTSAGRPQIQALAPLGLRVR